MSALAVIRGLGCGFGSLGHRRMGFFRAGPILSIACNVFEARCCQLVLCDERRHCCFHAAEEGQAEPDWSLCSWSLQHMGSNGPLIILDTREDRRWGLGVCMSGLVAGGACACHVGLRGPHVLLPAYMQSGSSSPGRTRTWK